MFLRERPHRVLALYALLAMTVWPVFPHFQSPNELTRWAAAAAVVEGRSLHIPTPVLGFLHPAFEDLSLSGGCFYSNKAPGLAFLTLPAYAAVRPLVGGLSPPSRVTLVAMRLLGSTLPALLLGIVFVRAALRFGAEASRIGLALFALFFATPVFAYGLLLFSHVLVAACLFGAFVALFLPAAARVRAGRDVLGGALLGLAVLSEYPALVPALVLLGCAAARKSWGRLFRIAIGGAPFAALLLLYDAACFGGPFQLSSAHERFPGFQSLAGSGFFGISRPTAAILASLLADPSKGLLVLSPFLAVVPIAYRILAHVVPRDAAAAAALVPVSMLVLYSGYPNWHGGFTAGVRYLVPALPFLVFPLAFRRGGRLETFLLGFSTAAVACVTLVFPFVPRGFALPWTSFAGPLLAKGLVAPNLGHLLGRPLAVALPFLVVLVAVVLSVESRSLAFFGAGVIVAFALGAVVSKVHPVDAVHTVERAYVEDVYFEREGALEAAVPEGRALSSSLLSRRDVERRLAPKSWPF